MYHQCIARIVNLPGSRQEQLVSRFLSVKIQLALGRFLFAQGHEMLGGTDSNDMSALLVESVKHIGTLVNSMLIPENNMALENPHLQ